MCKEFQEAETYKDVQKRVESVRLVSKITIKW